MEAIAGKAFYVQGDPLTKAALEVFNKERTCSMWFPWLPGSAPKEQLDRMLLEKTLQAQQEHREAMAMLIKQSQDSHKTVTEGIGKIVGEMAETAKQNNEASANMSRIIRRLTWAQVIVGAVSLAVAIIALVIATSQESATDKLIRAITGH